MSEACTIGNVYNAVMASVEYQSLLLEFKAVDALSRDDATPDERLYAREFRARAPRRLQAAELRGRAARETFEADCDIISYPSSIAISMPEGAKALASSRVAEGVRRFTALPSEIERLDADAAKARARYAAWEMLTGDRIQLYVDGLAKPQTAGALRPRR